MPSTSYRYWRRIRARDLDGMVRAHTALSSSGTGKKYATQQVNQAYAVLLAAQFQGFCRDLHSECADHLVLALSPPPALQPLLRAEFTRGRQLDRGNARSASLRADFDRLGIAFWSDVESFQPAATTWRIALDQLNDWRNAIAHQNFDPAKLSGKTTLQLAQVRRWRTACQRLARTFDTVLKRHLQNLTGVSPW